MNNEIVANITSEEIQRFKEKLHNSELHAKNLEREQELKKELLDFSPHDYKYFDLYKANARSMDLFEEVV